MPPRAPLSETARISILCALAASFSFSINDITVRSFASTLPLHEVVLFRSLIAFVLTALLLGRGQSLWQLLRTKRPGAQALRGLFVIISNFTFFAGLAALPLAEASAIFFVAPLVVTAFSAIFLREYVGPRRWLALCVGMAGVLLIIKPGSIAFHWALILPALSAVAYASMHIMTRHMGLSEPAVTMSLYVNLAFFLACGVMGLVFGDGSYAGSGHPSLEFLFRAWVMPTGHDVMLFFVAGFASGAGGYLITQAYRRSEAGLVAPFEYSSLVLAAIWGFVFWGEVPGGLSSLGICLILASGIFVALREADQKVPPGAKQVAGRR